MKLVHGTLTTTHVDRHGDRMTLSALESGVEQINRSFVPVGVEHDPRIPPQGRIVRGCVRELPDGEHALEGDFEMFEAGDSLPLGPEDRQLPIRAFPDGEIAVEFDRQLRSELDQQDINEIAALVGTSAEEEIKKSLDPLAILTIGGGVALGGIAAGFLSRIGEDAYEAIKHRLKAFFQRRNPAAQETLLRLVFVVRDADREVEVELIASRPDDEAIDRLLDHQLALLDEALPGLLASDPTLRRFVFEYSDRKCSLKFGVRRDAVPMFPTGSTDDDV